MRHIPALDGLRGVAIIGVMMFHYSHLLYGYLGLDLFFVLSGFLITGILIDSRQDSAYFRNFYVRRFLRIFPAYYAFLLLMFVVENLIHAKSHNYWWYITYLQNWQPGNGDTRDASLGHLWSLAVEEQFYIVWPLVIWLCPPRLFPWLCGVVALLTLVARCYFATFLELNTIWRVTPFRLDYFCLGGLAAYTLRSHCMYEWASKRFFLLSSVAIVSFLAAQYRAVYVNPPTYTAAAAGFAVLVLWAATHGSFLLNLYPLRLAGKYSYGMYLYHFPPHRAVGGRIEAWASHQSVAVLWMVRIIYPLAMMCFVFLLARLSWILIEQPFLKLKDRYSHARPLLKNVTDSAPVRS